MNDETFDSNTLSEEDSTGNVHKGIKRLNSIPQMKTVSTNSNYQLQKVPENKDNSSSLQEITAQTNNHVLQVHTQPTTAQMNSSQKTRHSYHSQDSDDIDHSSSVNEDQEYVPESDQELQHIDGIAQTMNSNSNIYPYVGPPGPTLFDLYSDPQTRISTNDSDECDSFLEGYSDSDNYTYINQDLDNLYQEDNNFINNSNPEIEDNYINDDHDQSLTMNSSVTVSHKLVKPQPPDWPSDDDDYRDHNDDLPESGYSGDDYNDSNNDMDCDSDDGDGDCDD